jgi:hypothetical protein
MKEENDITNAFLMKQILDELSNLKSNMPLGEMKHLQSGLENMERPEGHEK